MEDDKDIGLGKAAFLKQYVLNRALSGIDLKSDRMYNVGERLAIEAKAAWREIHDSK